MKINWISTLAYVDGWLPKMALFVPLIGYLILFNDKIIPYAKFDSLSNSSGLILDPIVRLKYVYFGLTFLGFANFIYRVRRPIEFRHGTNSGKIYTRNCLDIYTQQDYERLVSSIKKRDPVTSEGVSEISEWETTITSASRNVHGGSNWTDVKKIQKDILLGILWENFTFANGSRKMSLAASVILATIGYVLLLIPNADIFIRVLLENI